MLRLTRKAWNNVIIISMLLLIVLFNSTTNFLSGGGADSASSHYLLPEDATISTIEFSHYKLERIGQGWRSIGVNSQQADLENVIQAWHNAEIEQNATELNITQATASEVVYIWLVSHKTPIKFEVFQLGKLTLVLSQQHLYQLSATEFSSLFLSGAKDA